MNLNTEAHFSAYPSDVTKNRSTFDRSSNWKGSSVAGKLHCFSIDEILPGDTVNLRTTFMSRMTTPYFPVMDDAKLEQFFFFVKMSDVWDHAREFFGENDVSAWTQETEYLIPQIDATGSTHGRAAGDLAHEMGIPLNVSNANKMISSLPFRAYRKIWNEWFRDENLQAPKLLYTGDNDETDFTLFDTLPVCRVHDYFGSALPSPQKGDAVKIALSGFLPVNTPLKSGSTTVHEPIKVSTGGTMISGLTLGLGTPVFEEGVHHAPMQAQYSGSGADARIDNLYADLSAGLGIEVEALRQAIKLQTILEKMAVGGTRYNEFVKAMFGVTSPDARNDRSELLAHSTQYLKMNEVTQTSPIIPSESNTGSTPLGTVGAYSKTVDNSCAFEHSFTEHGFLIGVFCIRHNRSYSQGINKMWKRRAMTDVYLPSLALIGEQPIYTSEIYAANSDSSQIFGYNEAWSEYRTKPSINCGLLDPMATGSIGDVWTYGDVYRSNDPDVDPTPILSDGWIQEGSDEIARTLAVQDEDQFIHDVFIDLKHTRVMPAHSVPSLSTVF